MPEPVPIPTPVPSFWKRRLLNPVLALLTQGISPNRISATLATGTLCSLFPFLGATSLLNLLVGLWFRMNQPILQTLNQLLGPLQLILILAYVRLGERLWSANPAEAFTITGMLSAFTELSLSDFLQRFGWAGIHAFSAWALTAPLLFFLIHLPLRLLIRRLAQPGLSPVSPENP